MLNTGSEQQGQNIRVRTVFLTLTKILDLLVFFHQVCKNKKVPSLCATHLRQCALKTLVICLGLNPLVTNGLSHTYQMDESTLIFRDIRSNFSFLFYFSMKIKIANRIAQDGTPRFAASHLGLFCFAYVP